MMNTLEKLLLAWKSSNSIPTDITKGQLEEIRDYLPNEEDDDKSLLVAIDSAIANGVNRAA
jgi:hypothetical protein